MCTPALSSPPITKHSSPQITNHESHELTELVSATNERLTLSTTDFSHSTEQSLPECNLCTSDFNGLYESLDSSRTGNRFLGIEIDENNPSKKTDNCTLHSGASVSLQFFSPAMSRKTDSHQPSPVSQHHIGREKIKSSMFRGASLSSENDSSDRSPILFPNFLSSDSLSKLERADENELKPSFTRLFQTAVSPTPDSFRRGDPKLSTRSLSTSSCPVPLLATLSTQSQHQHFMSTPILARDSIPVLFRIATVSDESFIPLSLYDVKLMTHLKYKEEGIDSEKYLQCGDSWNALVVSDLHIISEKDIGTFNRRYVEEGFNAIPVLVALHDAKQLFILGDMFQGKPTSLSPAFVFDVFARLVSMVKIPIFVIGGNHDRWLFKLYKGALEATFPNRLKIFDGLFIELVNDNEDRLFFTHDGGNCFLLKPSEISGFIHGLKKKNARIPKDSYMISAHTHFHYNLLEKDKVCSVGALGNGLRGRLSHAIVKEVNGKFAVKMHLCKPFDEMLQETKRMEFLDLNTENSDDHYDPQRLRYVSLINDNEVLKKDNSSVFYDLSVSHYETKDISTSNHTPTLLSPRIKATTNSLKISAPIVPFHDVKKKIKEENTKAVFDTFYRALNSENKILIDILSPSDEYYTEFETPKIEQKREKETSQTKNQRFGFYELLQTNDDPLSTSSSSDRSPSSPKEPNTCSKDHKAPVPRRVRRFDLKSAKHRSLSGPLMEPPVRTDEEEEKKTICPPLHSNTVNTLNHPIENVTTKPLHNPLKNSKYMRKLHRF